MSLINLLRPLPSFPPTREPTPLRHPAALCYNARMTEQMYIERAFTHKEKLINDRPLNQKFFNP